jgi:hypothetical protein
VPTLPVSRPAGFVLLTLVVAVACVAPKQSDPALLGESSSGEEPSHGSTAMGTTIAPGPETSSSSSGEGESSGLPGINFLGAPDLGDGSWECDPYTQNCPPGQKCNYWANDGGGSWNATACFDIPPDASEVGEPCTVEDSGTSGIDSCVLGAMCWDVDPKTNEGTCAEMCTGSHVEPFCSDPSTICAGRGPYLCLPTCCPIEQDCPVGQACYPIQDTFSCAPDASGIEGGFGSPCEFINVCDPGLVCLGSEVLPPGYSCEGAGGCCTTLCETHQSACPELDPALECVPWYEESEPPPGLERLGVCALPQ